jgi:Uri superfamily endonuclease
MNNPASQRASDANAGTTVPARPGTYALLLGVVRRRRIGVGRLGSLAAAEGCYVYTGSACGPGGLRARLRHHLGLPQRPHWHIDYLRRIATPLEIWYSADPRDDEHAWAAICAALPGASVPLRRFGASDCACGSHLFHFSALPEFAVFEKRLLPAAASRRPICRVTDMAAAVPAVLQRRA